MAALTTSVDCAVRGEDRGVALEGGLSSQAPTGPSPAGQESRGGRLPNSPTRTVGQPGGDEVGFIDVDRVRWRERGAVQGGAGSKRRGERLPALTRETAALREGARTATAVPAMEDANMTMTTLPFDKMERVEGMPGECKDLLRPVTTVRAAEDNERTQSARIPHHK